MRAAFKTPYISLFSLVISLFAVLTFSCNNNKCKYVSCANGGICNSGACTCIPGYEGALCETVSRDRYIRTWLVWDSGSIAPIMVYTLSVTPDSPIVTQVWINNLYNYFTIPISGIVQVPSDDLLISPQSLMAKTVSGTGNYDTSVHLYLNYNVIDSITGNVDYRTLKSL